MHLPCEAWVRPLNFSEPVSLFAEQTESFHLLGNGYMGENYYLRAKLSPSFCSHKKKKPTNINIIPYFKMQSRIEIITFLEMKTILASQNIAKIKGAIVNFY